MANHVRSYFFPPSWDFPPGGLIQLGNIITSLDKPHQPVGKALYPEPDAVISSEKQEVEFSMNKLRARKLGFVASLVSLFGIELAGVYEDGDSHTFFFDKVHTTQFVPTQEYMMKCIQKPPVARHLEKTRCKEPLYLITSLKVVTGARAKSECMRTRGAAFSAQVDATVLSGGVVPVESGPELEVTKERSTSTGWESSNDLVFAFGVWKIAVARRTGEASGKEFLKGAMLEKGGHGEEFPFIINDVEKLDAIEIGGEAVVENADAHLSLSPLSWSSKRFDLKGR